MKNPRLSRGFSIIELMIGVALGLVILASLTTFFVSSSSTRNEIERTSRQIENGRFAIDSIRNELHLAGFFAELQTTGAAWQSPDPCDNTLGNQGLVLGPPLKVPVGVFGYSTGITKPTCAVNRVPGTDVIVIRRFHTEPLSVAAMNAANGQKGFYWQPSRCRKDSTTTPWEFNEGDLGAWALLQFDCNAGNPALLYRLHVTMFYVRDYSFTPGDGVSTLVKIELDPSNPAAIGGFVTSPIAEGISQMRLEYGVDNDTNGSPDEWRRCDSSVTCDLVTQWPNVTAVRVHVLAVNLEPTVGYTDQKTYDMGPGLTPLGPYNDQFKRHVYAAVVSLPNKTGPRE